MNEYKPEMDRGTAKNRLINFYQAIIRSLERPRDKYDKMKLLRDKKWVETLYPELRRAK